MIDFISWLVVGLVWGVVDIFTALAQPLSWLDWSDKQALVRFIYYGGSARFFFAVFDFFAIVFIAGIFRQNILWRAVRLIEGINNAIGRTAAWAALIMVIQQVMIIALQRIFRLSEISVGPFGYAFTRDLSWYAEELKLYNALIVALCAAYTFIQGGHVRVDLLYAPAKYRTKKCIDMFGSLFFVLPFTTIVWMFGWFFLWRHLITPKVSATDKFEALLRKSTIMRWNVETIGFSPNGFNGYFLFKVLLVCFAAMMFLQGVAFFYRSYLEYREGPDAQGKYLDLDQQLNEDPAVHAPPPTPAGSAASKA